MLLEQTNFKVWSPVATLSQDAKVCELIDQDTKNWRRDLVFNVFNQFEAQQIINIPISLRLPEDKIIWHQERDGEYSVRSAYHLICEDKNGGTPESSNARNQKKWKAIWKIPIPNCVWNFLWRIAKNILPTRRNLRRKGVVLDPLCLICNVEEESQEHLFMSYQATRALWFTTSLGIHVPQRLSFSDWMLQWMSCPDILAQQIFSVTLSKIWKARNQVVFNNITFKPIDIAIAAFDFVQEYNGANRGGTKPVSAHQQLRWQHPEPGVIKINVDAGCFENGTTGGE